MLGCKYYNYNAGLPKYDDMCNDNGVGVGWLAPIYFLLFAIVCGFVMFSTLIGLMISSMEQLMEIKNAEVEIWKDVHEIAKAYEISPVSVDLSLKLFESIDKEARCHLTFVDIQPLLKVAGVTDEQEQLKYYLKVDRDGSGQVEFPEFVEFLAILGFSLDKTALAKKKAVEKKERERMLRFAAALDNYKEVTPVISPAPNKPSGPSRTVSLGSAAQAAAAAAKQPSKNPLSVPSEKPLTMPSEKTPVKPPPVILPDTLVVLTLEQQKTRTGSFEQNAMQNTILANANMGKSNRTAVERKNYRNQSKKVDKKRLMQSFSVEPGGEGLSTVDFEALFGSAAASRRYEVMSNAVSAYGTYDARGDGGGMELVPMDTANAVSDFEEMAPIPEVRIKPRPGSGPGSRSGNTTSSSRVVVADLVMVDEE